MTTLTASEAVRLPPEASPHRLRWWFIASVLLHSVPLLLLIPLARRMPPPAEEAVPPAPIAMVFQSNSGAAAPSVANPAPKAPGQPGSPPPQPQQQPAPVAPPVPATEPTPPPPPFPEPSSEAPQPKPQPAPAAPTTPSQPQPAAPPPPPAATIEIPLPPPAEPHAPTRPAAPPTRQAAPSRPAPSFPAPMDFSFGKPTVAPTPVVPMVRGAPKTLDLSFAPTLSGDEITQLHPGGKDKDIGPDWFNLLTAWWNTHRYYPAEAARLEQEGSVMVHMVVAHNGEVETVRLERNSGSPWLDQGALDVFRGKRLPALPDDYPDKDVTLNFTIHYIIIR